MLILAIDTALDACAAAVLDIDAGRLIAQESQAMKRGHAEALMPLIARVIKAAGIAFAALDRIAVTTGPGSFTGLRVGLSAARGIALAADKPVVGLTTLAAYAAPVVSDNAGQRMRRRRSGSMRSRRRISSGWRGWEPRLIRIPRRPGRIICARPTPSFPRIGCRKPRSLKRHDQPCKSLAVRSVARRRGGG